MNENEKIAKMISDVFGIPVKVKITDEVSKPAPKAENKEHKCGGNCSCNKDKDIDIFNSKLPEGVTINLADGKAIEVGAPIINYMNPTDMINAIEEGQKEIIVMVRGGNYVNIPVSCLKAYGEWMLATDKFIRDNTSYFTPKRKMSLSDIETLLGFKIELV